MLVGRFRHFLGLFLQRLADAELGLGGGDRVLELQDAAEHIDGALEFALVGEAAAERHERLVGEHRFRIEAVEGEAGGGGCVEVVLQQFAFPLEAEGIFDQFPGQAGTVHDDGIHLA